MTDLQERELLRRIVVEPGKMGGKPIIRGRRITPGMVLKLLANGATREEVLAAYPVLEGADIDACLLYAALNCDRAELDGQSAYSAVLKANADWGLFDRVLSRQNSEPPRQDDHVPSRR